MSLFADFFLLKIVIFLLFASSVNLLTFIAGIAALITAIAALATAYETKISREKSVFPDITILETPFYDYHSKHHLFYNTIVLRDEIDVIENLPYYTMPSLKICNMGLGVAKNIKYKYNIEIQSIINTIKSLCDDEFVAEIKGNFLYISFENKKSDLRYNIFSNSNISTIEYLLPLSQDKTENWITLPDFYYHLYLWYFNLIKTRNLLNKINEFEPITLNISYNDLNEKTHHRSFLININYSHMVPISSSTHNEFFRTCHNIVSKLIKTKE